MKVSSLTLNVAWQITNDRILLYLFYMHALADYYIRFTHNNTFYSYPVIGKIWPDGSSCQPHIIETSCRICGAFPSRDSAGFGTIFLYRNGDNNRMNLYCEKHVPGNLFHHKPIQLSFF